MRLTWIFLCLAIGACAAGKTQIPDFNNRVAKGVPGQTIAFVGERVALKKVDNVCPKNHVCMDSKYQARYKILQLLEGEFAGGTIDFVVYDHYRFPGFAKHDTVVLYITQDGQSLIHQKYAYDALHPVREGGLATCGDPYLRYAPEQIARFGRNDLIAFTFDPVVSINLFDTLPTIGIEAPMSLDEMRERFPDAMAEFSPPAFSIENGHAVCKMGMRAEDIAEIRKLYEFSAAE